MAKKPFMAKQTRSRESLQRLLKATAEILTEGGLEGATIPCIAARAGLSPGAVYRRFPDKDALLQTVVFTVLEQIDENTRALLTPEFAKQGSLQFFAKQIIEKSLQGQRAPRACAYLSLLWTRGGCVLLSFCQAFKVFARRSK